MKTGHFMYSVCLLGFLMLSSTALHASPMSIRCGETITFAIGAAKSMTRANTTTTFTSDVDGVSVDLTANVISIFRLYADRASEAYQFGGNTASLADSVGHKPWVTVAVIDLPTDLTVGPGQVQFTTTTTYSGQGSHTNNLPISVKILPGTGLPSGFDYEFGIGSQLASDLGQLEAQPRAIFGPAYPSNSCPCPDYGAIEIRANLPTSLGADLDPAFVRVLADTMTAQTGSGRGFVHGLNNGKNLTVMLTSSTGALKYYEARFSVVLHSAVKFTGVPTITSVRYFDANGIEVSGPVADYAVVMQ